MSRVRPVDATVDHRSQRETLDRSDERYWTESDHYTGLTPLGVCEWLRITPEVAWPTTYEGLRRMGLGNWVVEWLEIAVAHEGAGRHEEAVVVRTFLHLLAESEMRRRWSRARGCAACCAHQPSVCRPCGVANPRPPRHGSPMTRWDRRWLRHWQT